MEAIISHVNPDFDSIASMVAAKKLYPKAEAVPLGHINRNVKEFLSLYRDIVDLKRLKYVDSASIKRLILVDVKSKTRIGDFSKLIGKKDLEIHDKLKPQFIPDS